MKPFLELLSSALYDRAPEPALFEGLTAREWSQICQMGRRQGVLALIGERVLALPAEVAPERKLLRELALVLHAVEQSNHHLHRELREVAEEYAGEGLPFVLLKGFTMARYYPKPLLRAVGDLDLYLYREGDYERANAYARAKGYRLQGESLYEQLYWRGKTAVENHRYIAYFGVPRYDKALSELLVPIAREQAWGRYVYEGESYETLPLELDAVYCFVHILHHFSYLGIGFRQVSDWLLLLEQSAERIDRELFAYYAERLDLLRPMRLFALMAVRHLGSSREVFPFDLPIDAESERYADLILSDILSGGNFGLEHFAGKRFKSVWARRWFMFRRTTARSLRVAPISPEHIRLKPLVAIFNRLRLLFHPKA